jgi:hypothetical protein
MQIASLELLVIKKIVRSIHVTKKHLNKNQKFPTHFVEKRYYYISIKAILKIYGQRVKPYF